MDVAGHQCRMCRGRTTIRNVHNFDAGHHSEQLAGKVGQVSSAVRSYVDLAGIGLCVGDELSDGFSGERRIDQQDEEIAVCAGNRDDLARDRYSVLLVKRLVDDVRSGDLQQRVAVGRRACDRL